MLNLVAKHTIVGSQSESDSPSHDNFYDNDDDDVNDVDDDDDDDETAYFVLKRFKFVSPFNCAFKGDFSLLNHSTQCKN